jgi:hypothetical protein
MIQNSEVEWIILETPLPLERSQPSDEHLSLNAGIHPEAVAFASRTTVSWLARYKLTPIPPPDGMDQEGMVFLSIGNELSLLGVRVTVGDETMDGTGPMPRALIERAGLNHARPLLVRVHLRNKGKKMELEWYGYDELGYAWKESSWWRSIQLRGRSGGEYLRITGGKPSRLEVRVRRMLPGLWVPEPQPPEFLQVFGPQDMSPQFQPGVVELLVEIDPTPRTRLSGAINWWELVRSTHQTGQQAIFTCTCGSPECGGFWRGVHVAHDEGWVVWRLLDFKPLRIVVFDQAQYQEEIFRKVRLALSLHAEMGPKASVVASTNTEFVEQVLREAEAACVRKAPGAPRPEKLG